MTFDNKKIAGTLLFVGAAQFVFAAIIAEALDIEYSFTQPMNWLGSGSAAAIFNASLIILGLLVVASAYLVTRPFSQQPFLGKLFWFLMTLTGIGIAGVGVFNENLGIAHVIFVRMFWIFAVPAMVLSFKFQKKPLAHFSAALGLLTLAMLILFLSAAYGNPSLYLGLGRGGMQRLIQYPILLWLLGFGAYLIGNSSRQD